MPPMLGRPRRAFLFLLASLLALAAIQVAPDDEGGAAAQALPPLPERWPGTLQLGQMDDPGGAAAMRSVAGFGFRYQYLAGGVNTGGGWATWDADGRFVTTYIQESVQAGIVPVFSYYQIFQSAPGGAGGEAAVVYANLQNTATMRAYYADLKLFFQRAGGFPSTQVVLHVEPDMWGYMQQRAAGDDAATVPVQVAATGVAEMSGLPNTLAGFARAVAVLRDAYAPNVVLGYHLSIWGTGVDPIYSNPPDAEVDGLATRAGNFYRSLGGRFDIAFAEFSDRDAGFKQYVYGDGGASWWDAADFRRNVRFLSRFTAVAQKRIVLWQLPYGNTKMRAMNNTWQHYQDNRVEWLLDDPGRGHLNEYLAAGVVAFLFGRGADGATCACDAAGDGVTNPAPVNGNARASLNADDDGGFFKEMARQYYAAGALALPGGGTPPPTPTATPSRTPSPTATAAATAMPTATPTPPRTTTATATATPSRTATTTTTPPRTATATATPSRTPTPAPTDTPGACPVGQFRAQYFPDRALSGTPRLTRCEARIDADWAGGGPGAGILPDNFSVRWNGRFTFAGGPTTFIVTADDGIRLWIDNDLLIDAWRDQAPTEYRATRILRAGVHRVRVEYYEHGGGAIARVRWE